MEEIQIGEVFTISDDEGQEQEVEVMGLLELNGEHYAAVSFVEDLEEDTEEDIDMFILKLDEEGDLSMIETDEEFDQVSQAFDEYFKEEQKVQE
ncbi:cyclopropane-fatty-acyl-phospholipid synthase [Bacillus coahuilensis m2-6]|uniref:Cyclopropane-fatty-acyl-phospholipid synthase n=1 Tax=Bacillus coahuilensis p1.1.43 TaxID=1150625 RepID=A0A147K838_9BACI|nr:DUF1292 domain-containing protein [Bacillus coahuilensis]KUP06371.1 cyclopropane-fatty-acyl-phospholipid synthase [Bacillus coahuilensis p1.1.43]KUP08242.1 cyclopropane-fatty-acyl-phospholipid synthase [Bacillus coahuilensis m2-6]